MSGAGGSASSAAPAVMQADRAAGVCKGVGLLHVRPASVHCWWLTSEHRGHRAHIYPPVSPSHKEEQSMLGLCVAVDAISVHWGPLRASPSCQTGTGTEDSCRQSQHQDWRRGKKKKRPAGLNRPRQFLFTRAEGNAETSHYICGAFVIKCDSSDGLLEVTGTGVRWSE